MKSLLVVFVSFFASLSFAAQCPNFSGQYRQIFPTAAGPDLEITQRGDVVNLSLTHPLPRPWGWQLKVDGQTHEKSLGNVFRDVYEIAKCRDNQIHSKLYGKKLVGNRVVNFTEQWIIYKNTSRELVWQKNYRDDSTEPRLDIYKYIPRR